jgi:hypothetical protein
MAYFDEDDFLPLWRQDALPEDILAGTLLDLWRGAQGEAGNLRGSAPSGYIILDWFGPFLLSPPARFVRGRC